VRPQDTAAGCAAPQQPSLAPSRTSAAAGFAKEF